MKFEMNDGTWAHLHGIVQTAEYRRDYKTMPDSASDEIKRIAQLHIPTTCWRKAPMVLIGVDPADIDEQMRARKLPRVMCVAEFISYRQREQGVLKPQWLYVVWLQEEMQPYFSASNHQAFRQIDWDNHCPN